MPIRNTEKVDVAEYVVDSATKCGDHPCDFPDQSQWDKVHFALQWCSCYKSGAEDTHCGSYCDTYGIAVVEMKNGTIWVASESSDTSGHG